MDLKENPGFLITRLARTMTNTISQRFEPYGVTSSQWSIIKVLKMREGLSQVEIQELLDLEGATVSGLVQRLVRQGLLERRADPVDKRVIRVSLTQRGRELDAVLTPISVEVLNQTFKGFSPDEQEFFMRFLKRAQSNFE